MKLPLILCLLILSSCAGSYHTINPERLSYNNKEEKKGLVTSYKYNLLKESNPYDRKEGKSNIKLAALKIKNKSSDTLYFKDDIQLFLGNEPRSPVRKEVVYDELKQKPAWFLFYLLFTFTTFNTCSGSDCSSTPIGVVLGPGLTLGNILAASGANNNFEEELNKEYITRKKIAPNSTTYGLIGVFDDSYNPIYLELK